jgi:hydroxymethylbilane synthase
MKDVPTALPVGIVQAAVLERATTLDILVQGECWFLNELGIIATEVYWRQAQWLNKYPTHKAVDLRGNKNAKITRQRLEWRYFAAAD